MASTSPEPTPATTTTRSSRLSARLRRASKRRDICRKKPYEKEHSKIMARSNASLILTSKQSKGYEPMDDILQPITSTNIESVCHCDGTCHRLDCTIRLQKPQQILFCIKLRRRYVKIYVTMYTRCRPSGTNVRYLGVSASCQLEDH